MSRCQQPGSKPSEFKEFKDSIAARKNVRNGQVARLACLPNCKKNWENRQASGPKRFDIRVSTCQMNPDDSAVSADINGSRERRKKQTIMSKDSYTIKVHTQRHPHKEGSNRPFLFVD